MARPWMIVVVWLVACTSQVPLPVVSDAQTYCVQWTDQSCDEIVIPCCGATRSQCINDVFALCMERVSAAIDLGFVFHADRGGDCLDAQQGLALDCQLRSPDSAEAREHERACQRMWEPPTLRTDLEVGASCDGSLVYECKAELTCDDATERCVAEAMLGAECTESEQCTSNLCVEGHCQAQTLAQVCSNTFGVQ